MTKEEKDIWLQGYHACERKYRFRALDVLHDNAKLNQIIMQKVKIWFEENTPEWGMVTDGCLWPYKFAKHFYKLGRTDKLKELSNKEIYEAYKQNFDK